MNNVLKTIKYFNRHSWKYKRDLILASTVGIQVFLNVTIIPLLIGFGISKISRPESVGLSFGAIILIMVIASLIAIFFNRISSYGLDRFELSAVIDIENEIANHIIHESYEFHSKSFSGALINQATKLSSAYITYTDTVFMSGIRWIIIVFASSITLTFYDVKMAMILLSTSLTGIIATTIMVRKRYPYQKNATKMSSKFTAYLADMVTNAVTVKTFAREKFELSRYDDLAKKTAQAYRVAWHKQINANNVTLAMVSVMNVTILGYGIYGVQHGTLAAGVFIAAQLYAIRLSGAFWDSASMLKTFERLFADAHEMIEILDHESTLKNSLSAKDLVVKNGEIKFNNVSFHYSDADSKNSVLKNFTLNLQPGEKVGLVGRSGGGKTTITKLVLRFMDIQSGEIFIDNQNIAEVTQESLRQAISYVPQEPLLFHRTIAENIGYGNPSASLDEIIKAAKKAQAHEFIKSLPKQYDTEVGERGVKLSGGQRQRVAIARALLKDSNILVLDEATSALDSESEVLIQKALWKLMENRTALVIAHRLSTIQKMDRIIVVDEGQIIEQGTHAELIKAKGVYAELWAHQSGGFLTNS